MAEINSIANGSFVLGQTSAENPSLLVNENSEGNVSILQGTVATSAGIVGDGSTQNPLRADETVLFDNDLGLTNLTLSGNPMDYERLKIYFGTQRNGSVGNNIGMNYSEIPTSILSGGRQGSYGFLTLQHVFWGNNTSGTNPYMAVSEFSGTTGTNWKIVKGMLYNLTASTLDQNNNWNYIYKVIGINRKAQ